MADRDNGVLSCEAVGVRWAFPYMLLTRTVAIADHECLPISYQTNQGFNVPFSVHLDNKYTLLDLKFVNEFFGVVGPIMISTFGLYREF